MKRYSLKHSHITKRKINNPDFYVFTKKRKAPTKAQYVDALTKYFSKHPAQFKRAMQELETRKVH
jgi:hypothetical protein